jgi:DNA-binding response OmpR family regulator
VLLVEDNPSVRAFTATALRSFGYAVLEAETGEAALAASAAHSGPIHLLLSDIVMPGLPAGEVATRLTAARPGLRVLFTSGYPDDEELRAGIGQREVAFLPKPFSLRELAARIREVLGG